MIPAIEKLKIQNSSINIYASMVLASIPVTVSGQYNIHSNSFYPSTIAPVVDVFLVSLVKAGEKVDFEEFCEAAGWDYFDTHSLVQKAVEAR